jgi:type VI secretion system protein ImpK
MTRGLMALAFQEALTAIVRLRAGRQPVSDAAEFRQQMRDGLRAAARQARDEGCYESGDVRLATFAVVAFLDESVLTANSPALANWRRQPLQEELFGTHVAGELFFENVRDLLNRPDSAALADLLEVYCLAIALGFAGRHTGGRRGELGTIAHSIRQRIARIRGGPGELSPSWTPAGEGPPPAQDRRVRQLAIAAAATSALAAVLFLVYTLLLAGPVSQAREMASGVLRP